MFFACFLRPASDLREEIGRKEEQVTAELESQLNRLRSDLEAAEETERRLAAEDADADRQLEASDEAARRIRLGIDQLTQEIKEANLQSLSIAPADDLKVLLEGNPLTPLHID